MSSLINKVKDKLSGDKETTGSSNYGSHNSNTLNQADPRFDSNLNSQGQHAHHDAAHAHHHTTTGTGVGGPGANTGYGAGQTGTTGYSGSSSAGPHNSNVANKLDPRVDSDLDNRNNPTSRVGGYGGQESYGTAGGVNPAPGSGGYGNTGHSGVGHSGVGQTGYDSGATGTGYSGSSNAGPHNSNLANKLDPRVDSDVDNRNNPTSRAGGYGGQESYGTAGGINPAPSSGGYGNTGHSGVGQTGSGAGHQSTTGTAYSGQTTAGPHDSNMANKLDPRVDSDRSNVQHGAGGYGQDTYNTGAGAGYGNNPTTGHSGIGQSGYGNNPTTGHSGIGQSGYGNNPTTGHSGIGQSGYDSHSTGQQGYGSSATPGSGNAPSTAGPHNSNLLNKIDPRVDSDLDGSKTMGGNKTNY